MEIKCDPQLANYIEACNWEMDGVKELLTMVMQNPDLAQHLDYYTEQYIFYRTEFEKAKESLTKKYNLKGEWSLDYGTQIITVK